MTIANMKPNQPTTPADGWWNHPLTNNAPPPPTSNCTLFMGKNCVCVMPLEPTAEDYAIARQTDAEYPAKLKAQRAAWEAEAKQRKPTPPTAEPTLAPIGSANRLQRAGKRKA